MRCSKRKGGRVARVGPALKKLVLEPEPLQHGLAASADEFATNAMARIATGLPDCYWDSALAKSYPESKPGKPAAHNGYRFGKWHVIEIRGLKPETQKRPEAHRPEIKMESTETGKQNHEG